ncbi:MAG: RIP metalloprotease RseP [Candidatus Eisenbacteria bacterium]|nr:RIP metalloprotease RseP [Candidatus Eisenbacteria bacterium]
MGNLLETIRAFLLVLPPIIFFHELGHFLVARWCGVRVVRFAMGFGPVIFKYTHGGVEYCLCPIPLGGYVKMAGDSLEDPERTGAPDEFLGAAWWKRVLIAVAGPLSNLLLAFVVLVIMFRLGGKFEDYPAVLGRLAPSTYAGHLGLAPGDRLTSLDGKPIASWMNFRRLLDESDSTKNPVHELGVARGAGSLAVRVPDRDLAPFLRDLVPHRPAVIGTVLVGGAAYLAGLKDGDEILSVNGTAVGEWIDLTDIIFGSADKPLKFHVRRAGREADFIVTPQAQEEGPKGGRVGIAAQSTQFYYEPGAPWGRAVRGAWLASWSQVVQTYAGLARLVNRPKQFSQQVGGPIMIGQIAGYEARRGWSDLLGFCAFISIAIMVFNLLPIPILDGGHVLLALLEVIQRRALTVFQIQWAQRIGLVVVLSIVVFAFGNDIRRLVERRLNLVSGETRVRAAPRENP